MTVSSFSQLPLESQAQELRQKIRSLRLCVGNEHKIASYAAQLEDIERQIEQTQPALLQEAAR